MRWLTSLFKPIFFGFSLLTKRQFCFPHQSVIIPQKLVLFKLAATGPGTLFLQNNSISLHPHLHSKMAYQSVIFLTFLILLMFCARCVEAQGGIYYFSISSKNLFGVNISIPSYPPRSSRCLSPDTM